MRQRPRGGSEQDDPGVETTRTPGGLTRRMVLASVALAAVVGAAFTLLLLAVADVRRAERSALKSQDVLVAANTLERLLLDLETGQRGFIITKQEQFLEPWREAQPRFPQDSQALLALTSGHPQSEERARSIVRAMRSYIDDYSLPLVDAARRGEPSASGVAAAVEGKARVDAIRTEFDRLIAEERRTSVFTADESSNAVGRAYVGAAVGIGGSVALIAAYAGYVSRAIVRPMRRAAAMAGRLAGGDLTSRLPETGVGELGALERAFNVMGASLERSRDELAALAAEQAALRRVATLVAHAAAPDLVFAAVAREVGQLLPLADYTFIARYDAQPDHQHGQLDTRRGLGRVPGHRRSGRAECHRRGLDYPTSGQDQQLRAHLRGHRGVHSRVGHPLLGGHPDQRRGPAVGGGSGGLGPRAAAAGRHREPAGQLHRTGRHRHRQRRGPRRTDRIPGPGRGHRR